MNYWHQYEGQFDWWNDVDKVWDGCIICMDGRRPKWRCDFPPSLFWFVYPVVSLILRRGLPEYWHRRTGAGTQNSLGQFIQAHANWKPNKWRWNANLKTKHFKMSFVCVLPLPNLFQLQFVVQISPQRPVSPFHPWNRRPRCNQKTRGDR